jgi:hypothetical protein
VEEDETFNICEFCGFYGDVSNHHLDFGAV